MQVGDLVRFRRGYPYLGLVMSFDKDGDPIIEFSDDKLPDCYPDQAYYITDIEVVSETI